MGKKIRKWLCVVLAVVMMASALPLVAGAIAPTAGGTQSAQSSNDGTLKVEIKSDKDRYTLLGKMEFTATITNTSNETVEDISAQALLGASLRPLANGSQFTATKASLAPNESFSFKYCADLGGLKSLDNLLFPVFWVSSLIHGGKANIGTGNGGADYIEARKTVELVSAFSGQYDASTSVRVWCKEIFGGGDTDFGEDEIYEYDPITDVSYDEDLNTYFVNNIVIIDFNWDCTDKRKIEVVESVDGKIAGRIDGLNELHVRIKKSTLEEILNLCDKLNESDDVFAHFDEIIEFDSSADQGRIIEPTDPWDGTDITWNDEDREGTNGWLKIIKAPSAWTYNDYFSPIKIGIIDAGFQEDHDDLRLSFSDQKNKESNVVSNHGTHVAGIIGASHNNIGITGIIPKSNLLCYSLPDKINETKVYEGINSLLESGCKIVNISLEVNVAKDTNDTLPAWKIKFKASIASEKMAKWLENSDIGDFVIVQAAGNGAKKAGSTDPDNRVGFDAINTGMFNCITSGNCYAKSKNYSVESILNRIITVTSTLSNDTVAVTANGGSQVDIAAPGHFGTYSTLAGIQDSDKNIVVGQKYGNLYGTSMAAPMVTGVAGLVWSIVGNDFDGSKVKEIVCGSYDSNVWAKHNENSANVKKDFRLVNAKLAVEQAIRQTYTAGTLSGRIRDKDTEEPLEGALVTITSTDKTKVIPVKTNSEGKFSLVLPVGNYTLEATHKADGVLYEPYVTEVIVVSGVSHYEMLMHKKTDDDNDDDIPLLTTITGKVIEQSTNAPLLGVLVEAMKAGSTAVVATATTNVNGSYVVAVERNEPYNLKFTKDGYAEQTRSNVNVAEPTMALADVVMASSDTVPSGYIGIYTPQDLNNVRNDLSANYILMNDIDLASWGNWEPIGDVNNPFIGTFDGNGYLIKGLIFNISNDIETIYCGLFSYIYQANIKNVNLMNGKISASSFPKFESDNLYTEVFIGALAGHSLQSNIENCFSSVDVSGKHEARYYMRNNAYVGGLIGASTASNVTNCTNAGNIYGSSQNIAYVGGIIGCSTRNSLAFTTILSSKNIGDVYGESDSDVYSGGICGFSEYSAIERCYNIGSIIANCIYTQTSCYAGGIVGYIMTCTTAKNCYNIGNVNATAKTLYGQHSKAGGVFAHSNTINYNYVIIENCYNAGNISAVFNNNGYGTVYWGAIHAGNATIENCYSLESLEKGTGYNGAIMTISEMKQQASFAGFDFGTIWAINPSINNGYPYLQDLQP